MQLYGDVVLDLAGNAVPNAQVRVLTQDGAVAAIFDAAGASVGNPVKTGAVGDFAFQAANGKYLLQISIGAKLYRTVGPVSLYDPGDVRAPPRLQVVATRGRFPSSVTGGAPDNYTRAESTIYVKTGPRKVNSIQVVYCNKQSVTGGETYNNTSEYSLESAIYYGAITTPFTFAGNRNPVCSPGAAFVVSDKMALNLPANSSIQLRSGAVVASGGKSPGGQQATNQYAAFSSTASVSQVYNNTAMATPAGGASPFLGFTPLAVLGIPDKRHVAVLLWGDSITYGTGDAVGESTFGHIGWAERGLIGASEGGTNTPFVNASRTGDSTNTWGAGAIGFQGTRWGLLEYVTHAVFSMGINDISAGRTLAQLQANVQNAWSTAKALGVKAYQTTLTPNVTTTDAYATLANQTPVANYTTAGIRGQFNAWLPSQVAAGNIDGIIDVNSAVCDPSNPDKWAINGSANYMTADGLHPSTAAHILMASVLNTVASAWTAS